MLQQIEHTVDAMWNDIELSTNDDTVTGRLCIDSRHECGTALYQVDTLVKVSSSDKVRLFPVCPVCNGAMMKSMFLN